MTDHQSFDRNRQSCFRDREVIADLRLKLRSQGDVFSNWDQIVIAISMCDKDRNRDRDLNFGDQSHALFLCINSYLIGHGNRNHATSYKRGRFIQ